MWLESQGSEFPFAFDVVAPRGGERQSGDQPVAEPEQCVHGAGRCDARDRKLGELWTLLRQKPSHRVDVDVDLVVVHLHVAGRTTATSCHRLPRGDAATPPGAQVVRDAAVAAETAQALCSARARSADIQPPRSNAVSPAGPQSMNRGRKDDNGNSVCRSVPFGLTDKASAERSPCSWRYTNSTGLGEYVPASARWSADA